jgi:hypothetical protein
MVYQEYLAAAREFAKTALSSEVPAVVIQNAHKAVEFALMVYCSKKELSLPMDHWQTKNLAYRIDRSFGKAFGELLRMYLRAYRVKDGGAAQRAKELMRKLVRRIEELAGEVILPE